MRALLAAGLVSCALATVLAQSGTRPSNVSTPQPYTTWGSYLGGAHSAQFTALREINTSNVSRLEVVWRFPAGARSQVSNASDGARAFICRVRASEVSENAEKK